jgi:hypothetical protein
MAPVAIKPATRWLACCAEPHWQSTVMAPVCHGRPPCSQAVRVTLLDCSPAWVTQPPMTCSTKLGSMPQRSTIASWAAPSNSAACRPASQPPRLPIGVRTASTMTGVPTPLKVEHVTIGPQLGEFGTSRRWLTCA